VGRHRRFTSVALAEEVQRAADEHVLQDAAPGVEGCAVVGVADDRLGERVVAAVIVQPGSVVTEGSLRAHCTRCLARSKVREEFRIVDELPRNDMGTVIKRLVVSWFDGTVQQ